LIHLCVKLIWPRFRSEAFMGDERFVRAGCTPSSDPIITNCESNLTRI
jgi:hypothetical protein